MTELLRLALEAHSARDAGTPRQKLNFAVQLGEFEKLSKRQIATITGLSPMNVQDAVKKSSKSGGGLTVESLPVLGEVAALDADTEEYWRMVYRAYSLGASVNAICTLLGLKPDQVWYWVRKLKKEGA